MQTLLTRDSKIHNNAELTLIEAVVFPDNSLPIRRCSVIMPKKIYVENRETLDTLTFRIDGAGIDDKFKILMKPKTLKLKEFIEHGITADDNQYTLDLIEGIKENTLIDVEALKEFSKRVSKKIIALHVKMNEVVTIKNNIKIDNLELNIGDQVRIKRKIPEYIEI